MHSPFSRDRGTSASRTPVGRLRAAVTVVALVLVGATVPVVAASAAVDPCTTGGNPIVCENSKPGTDPDEWDIWPGAGDDSIQGFATDISVDGGDRIDFKIDTDARNYDIDIYRTGWYQGLGARFITSVPVDVALPQRQPECQSDLTTELYDCGNWAVSAHWNVPTDATSGVYIAKLTRADTGGASHITFIVRDDDSHSELVFQTADPTWHAYNAYGGSDFYQGADHGRAYKISYNRPFATRGQSSRDFYFSSEYAMVRYLEQNGYDVSYIAGVDSDRYGSLLRNHETFLSVGHDEYWSGAQRANVEAARDAGVNLAFFSGNEVYWRTRYEPATAGAATPYRTLVSYKETWSNTKIDPTAQWTGTWRDPRFASPANGGGRPENSLSGTMYMVNFSDLPLTVTSEEGKLRLWRNTDLTNLPTGTTRALAQHTVGYESNEDVDNGHRPAGLVRLSTTVGAVPEYLQDFGNVVKPGTTSHHITLYRAASGALVFSAGTIQWAWGLDQTHDGDGAPADARMRQATMNLLADMGAQPRTPASGLVATPASADTAGPTATITSPAAGARLANGTSVTVTGTAADTGGRVAGVEVSLDDGASWHPAQGRGSWSYTGILPGAGSSRIKVRATDDSANIGTVASTTVDVSCPCSLYGATVPKIAAADDTTPVELGLRFSPQVDGYVTGVRFYKGSGNTGTHFGSLWSATGQQLAQVTFENESATGWQTASFSTPVAVTADQPYVVSYTAPRGSYAVLENAFSSRGIDAYPLAVDGGFDADPAGVFGYPGELPSTSFGNASYYVDVLFSTTDASPLSVYGRAPAAGAVSVPLGTTVSATFSKPVDPTSVRVTLKDSVGTDVAGSTRYDAVTRTVTFTPAAPLGGFVEYTATVAGRTADGLEVTSGGSWTFRTLRPPSDVCPCGIFDESVLPGVGNVNDPDAVTLGMRFRASRPGSVSGVQFYKGAGNVGPFTVHLWGPDGALLRSASVASPVASGWQEVAFDAPVPVEADALYTVSYRTQSGHYSVTTGGLGAPLSSGYLSTPDNAGAFTYGNGWPSESVSTSYLVDVMYTPGTTAPTLSGRTPSDGAIDVSRATTVSVRSSDPLASGFSFTLEDALGNQVAGSTSVSTDGRTFTFDPSDALAAGAHYTARFSGNRASDGQAVSTTWDFTTQAANGACPCTLFGSGAPAVESEQDGAAVELGVVVVPDDDGFISAVRFYKGAGNGGTHTGSLWSEGGTRLATTTFTEESATGWQTASFDEPIPVVAGETYVVSYYAPVGRYAYDSGFFASSFRNGPLTAPAHGSRYIYGGGFPEYTYGDANYWVDAVFTTGGLRVTTVTPGDGQTRVDPASTVTARLSYAPLTSSPTLSLSAGGSAIGGTSSYDSATRTATFTPAAALPFATVVTATVTLDGQTLRTWQFTTGSGPLPAVGLWSDTDVPAVAAWNDPDGVQVGTRITAQEAGTVTAIRFYKGAGNTGTHEGYVWSASGALLGSGEFTAESAEGWQTLVLADPVEIAAGQSFVVSYWAPNGHYAVTVGGLAESRTVGPLTTPADGGTYLYGHGSPSSNSAHNFWVDVVFRPEG